MESPYLKSFGRAIKMITISLIVFCWTMIIDMIVSKSVAPLGLFIFSSGILGDWMLGSGTWLFIRQNSETTY